MMTISRKLLVPFAIILITVLIAGCSGNGADPITPTDSTAKLVTQNDPGSERHLWGIWDISFDPVELEISIEPVRNAEAHFDITLMVSPPACDDCLEIAVNSFDPVTRILDADVTLSNPFPITGKDVRGILYTNDYGHLLTNPDDWTDLYDIPDGEDINPFKAFAKTNPLRVFAGYQEHMENYLVYIPVPPSYFAIRFAVDASWPGNAKEPYSIENFAQLGELYDMAGSQAEVQVEVLDWQEDVDSVTLESPEIIGPGAVEFTYFGGSTWTLDIENVLGASAEEYGVLITAGSANSDDLLYDYFEINVTEALFPTVTDIVPSIGHQGQDLFEISVIGLDFQGPGAGVKLIMTGEPDVDATNVDVLDANTIACDISIPLSQMMGLYDVEVTNGSGLSGIGEDLFEIQGPLPDSPLEITPPWLNFTPENVFYAMNYAYVAGGMHGLHIFDVTDPMNPIWVSKLDTPSDAEDVYVLEGDAYVACISDGLLIVDLEIPEAPFISGLVPGSGYQRIDYSNGYIYAGGSQGVTIIDVDPIEEAYVVNTVETASSTNGVNARSGIVYAADHTAGLTILDVDPPLDAFVITTVALDGQAKAVDVDGDYAFVADYDYGLQIVDISIPESAWVVNTVDTDGRAMDIEVQGGYAFIADGYKGVTVMDVSPVGSAAVVTSFLTPGIAAYSIALGSGYAAVGDKTAGLIMLDIDPPESTSIIGSARTPGGALGVNIGGGCAYVANNYDGLYIADIDPPADTVYISGLGYNNAQRSTLYNAGTVFMGGQAYLRIIDVTTPSTPVELKTLSPGGTTFDIVHDSGYVFAANSTNGLQIIDIDPLMDADVVNTVTTTNANGVYVELGYAYVADGDDGLRIVDIDPIESASIVNTVDTDGFAWKVATGGGYAYVADGEFGLQIIDIDPPETASVVNTVATTGNAVDVVISDGYAYVATDSLEDLHVIDIDPFESAFVLATLPLPGNTNGLVLDGDNILYISAETGGLRIVQLW